LLSKKKIASIVLNSVSNDSRVLREADSLQCAGYTVTIFGLKLGSALNDLEQLPSGVTIIRVDYYGHKRRLLLALFSCFVLAPLALFISLKFMFSSHAVVLFSLISLIVLCFALTVKYIERDNVCYLFIRLLARIRSINQLQDYLRFCVLEYIYRQAFNKAIIDFGPDYIHAHDLSALPLSVYFKDKHQVKLLYDSHEIFEEMSDKNSFQKKIYQTILARLSESVDKFITINESIGKYINSKYPKLPKAVIVKNASPYSIKVLSNVYNGCLHEASGVSRQKKIALYQGRFSINRGLEGLVRSAAFFPEDWVLVLMGWGPLENTLKFLSQDINFDSKKVAIVPGVSQELLPYWTQGAAIGVIPYLNNCLNHYYCSPNKLWEYPRSGVPIIASSFPELKEPIVKAKMGWVIDDFDKPQEFASLLTSISDRDLEIAKANAIKFISIDNWKKYEQVLLKTYKNWPS
jgi:glycosyltransferase involved in cell wall biosynthesis